MLLARVTGLEPATSDVTGRRSNQLSYTRSGRGGIRPQRRQRQDGRRAGNVALIPDDSRARGMGGDGLEPPTLSV